MPSNSGFAGALLIFAQESQANFDALMALRAQAFSMITAGGGEISRQISGTINGKSATFEVNLDCSELFTILTQVLQTIADEGDSNARASSFDFSCYHQH